MLNNRTPGFDKNMNLERLLNELGSDLEKSEKELENRYSDYNQKYPLILIMGPLRSGTTLFMQWMADSGLFAYPTNLLSRFYYAPILGAKIQLLLTDPQYKFRNELGDFQETTEFYSENGKTKGTLGPNEFWYFWRQYLANPSRDIWSNDELEHSLDDRALRAAVIGMMEVFNKPFVAKGMLFNYNIPYLNKIFDNVMFIQIKRELESNVASAIEARKRQFGTESSWYSFKIPEYEVIKDLDSIAQVTGQIFYTNRAINYGLSKIDDNKKLIVQYEDFCQQPEEYYIQIREKLLNQGYLLPEEYSGHKSFTPVYTRVKGPFIQSALDIFRS